MIPRSSRLQKKRVSFFVPFFITLAILFFAILFIRWIIQGATDEESSKTPVARFSLLAGNGRVFFSDGLPISITPSSSARDLNIGEGVETIGASRLHLTLQDGSIVRLDGNTSLHLTDFKSVNNKKIIAMNLKKGTIWVKIAYPENIESFRVDARLSLAMIHDGIFSISSDTVQDLYQGVQGTASISLPLSASESKRTTLSLQLGQQIQITDESVKDIMAEKPVSFLSLLDPSFLTSDWYNYNHALDMNRTDMSNENQNNFIEISNNNSAISAHITAEDPIIITYPKEGSTVTDDIVSIRGTASSHVSKIIVDDYTLQKFTSGDSTWVYKASVPYGNLKEGKNTIVVYSLDNDGNKSKFITLTFYYKKQQENTSPATDHETVQPLSAPVILEPNGGKDFETSHPDIIIAGTVDTSAEQVVVNGYALKKFVPGSGKWQYFAYEKYEALKPGENEYVIYAVDKNGKKSPSITFHILYDKPVSGTGSAIIISD